MLEALKSSELVVAERWIMETRDSIRERHRGWRRKLAADDDGRRAGDNSHLDEKVTDGSWVRAACLGENFVSVCKHLKPFNIFNSF